MSSSKDFEEHNARAWERDSSIAPSEAGDLDRPLLRSVTISNESAIPPASQSRIPSQSPLKVAGNVATAAAARRAQYDLANGGNRGSSSANDAFSVPNHYKHSVYRPATRKVNRNWAEPPDLEKERYKKDKTMRAAQEAKHNKYLGIPQNQDELPGTGFYLWPKNINSKDEDNIGNHPRDLFGINLEKLDYLRRAHSVWICWDDSKRCIKVLSQHAKRMDVDIPAAIRGIRQAVRNANAEAEFASPIYIVVPPSGKMTSIIKAKTTKEGAQGAAPVITSLWLSGEALSKGDQKQWDSELEDHRNKNFATFKEHLAKHTIRLAPIVRWMRMRVHLGHLNIRTYKEEFGRTGLGFSEFVKMMANPRTTSTCTFDRQVDGIFATGLMQEIIESPDIFCPKESRFSMCKDVMPKHTLVLFLETNGQTVRVEATIDYVLSSADQAGGTGGWDGIYRSYNVESDRYQLGTTFAYYNNTRNKRAQITTIDIQKGFDWTLEIIEDGTFPSIPSQVMALMESAVSGNTVHTKVDDLGLPYPGITLRPSSDLQVGGIVLRSIYEYQFKESEYVVEIAIYRRWENHQRTHLKPELQSSVSLYHRVWDEQTASIEGSTDERKWDRQLKVFFNQEHQVGGLECFLDRVTDIQDMLARADSVWHAQSELLEDNSE